MRRWRKMVLWIGCTLCLLILATWVVSAWWGFAIRGREATIIFTDIGVTAIWDTGRRVLKLPFLLPLVLLAVPTAALFWLDRPRMPRLVHRRRRPLLRVAKRAGLLLFVMFAGGGGILLYWLAVFHDTRYPLVNQGARWLIGKGQAGETAFVTVWLLGSILAASATASLFWIDCRSLPGHCPCGYDLTGNTSGVCPECGVEVQA